MLEDDHVVLGEQCLLGGDVDLEVGVSGIQVVHRDMGQIADRIHKSRIGPRLGQVWVAYDKQNLGHEKPFSDL
jgi:hypothetical protein